MSRLLGKIDHLRGCFYVLQNFLQGMDRICSGILMLPAVAVRVLHEREGLGCRYLLRAVMVCLLRDLHKEHTLLSMELVSVGHVQNLGGFHALGQGFVHLKKGHFSVPGMVMSPGAL